MIATTLNRIKGRGPCFDGWVALMANLNKTKADDEPLSFTTILESNGLDDALWCMRACPEHSREWRLFAVWCARRVEHLTSDERALTAIDVAEKYANSEATDEELNAAWGTKLGANRDEGSAPAWAATAAKATTRYIAWNAAEVAARAALAALTGSASRATIEAEFRRVIS